MQEKGGGHSWEIVIALRECKRSAVFSDEKVRRIPTPKRKADESPPGIPIIILALCPVPPKITAKMGASLLLALLAGTTVAWHPATLSPRLSRLPSTLLASSPDVAHASPAGDQRTALGRRPVLIGSVLLWLQSPSRGALGALSIAPALAAPSVAAVAAAAAGPARSSGGAVIDAAGAVGASTPRARRQLRRRDARRAIRRPEGGRRSFVVVLFPSSARRSTTMRLNRRSNFCATSSRDERRGCSS